MTPAPTTLAGVPLGGAAGCQFIFEVSNNHNGDRALAHRLIDGAKAAGAAFVKVQAYTPDELVALRGDGPAPAQWGAQGWTMRALYEQARTPLDWLPDLFAHARDVGLVPFASVFGPDSLAACEALGCPVYKIARLDNGVPTLAAAVRATGKPRIVSAAGGDAPAGDADVWLWCEPGYPSDPVGTVPRFAPATLWTGMSSHCLDPLLPVIAVARGCRLIEMHGMLDDVPSALEANISLPVSAFRRMVEAVRRTEELIG